MDIDELKQTWQTMHRQQEHQYTLQRTLYRDHKLDTVRSHLRPLVWGQTTQILFGAAVVFLSAIFWQSHWPEWPMRIAGIVMHVYGIIAIAMAAVTLIGLHRIDYTKPVLPLQTQLAEIRRLYVLGGMWTGLPWFVLWLPVSMMVLKSALGLDLYSSQPWWIWINAALGVLGILVLARFLRRSPHLRGSRLTQWVDDTLTGRSLLRAQHELDALARFERD